VVKEKAIEISEIKVPLKAKDESIDHKTSKVVPAVADADETVPNDTSGA